MSALSIDRTALDALAEILLETAGLKITPDGYHGLRLALQARLPALKLHDANAYIDRLKRELDVELRRLLPLVTVGKTEFFRDSRQFQSFENAVLPALIQTAVLEGRQGRIWSAGCATGEEPYSLSMAALEQGATPALVHIRATDINPVAVETASTGAYPVRRMVGLSEQRLKRFFTETSFGYTVNSQPKSLIEFRTHNLAAPVWRDIDAQSLDVIFCRNVIIYFDQPTIAGVLERFYEVLRPGGWLFLGYSESMFKFTTRFEMVEVAGAFVYQRPTAARAKKSNLKSDTTVRSSTDIETALRALRHVPPPKAMATAQSTPALLPVGPLASTKARHADKKTPVERLAEVIDAIERGDFPKALRLIRLLTDEEPQDLGALLTLGNVHSLMSHVDEAREVFELALSREPLCVEARLYLALAEMQGGALDEARKELSRALFLEPTLALGHYLLGQVSERLRDEDLARRSYRNAISYRKEVQRELIGHFPELPNSNQAVAQAAQFRLSALAERAIP
jgi:chemotaxis protein methyltransferase CheR